MFVRSELKAMAKNNIRKNLFICMGICIATSILAGSIFGVNLNLDTNTYYFRVGLGTVNQISLDFIYLPIPLAVASLISLLSLAYSIFISNPLQIGQACFFMENKEAPSKFETLFKMFQKGIYMNVVKIMLLRDIKLVLWTLLLIIPSIYKSYQYYMIPYILAENPGMDSADVFEMTKIMTKDVKLDIFILNLSFIGWYLLSIVTCGLSILYVMPYTAATDVELYYFLRQRAVDQGYFAIVENDDIEVEHVEPTIEDLH